MMRPCTSPMARWSFETTTPSGRSFGRRAASCSPKTRPSSGGGPLGPDPLERHARVGHDRGANAFEALADLTDLLAGSDVGQPPAAGRDQVLGGEAPAGDVVERHRGQLTRVVDRVDEDHGDAAAPQPLEPGTGVAERADQRAFDLDPLEQLEVIALLGDVVAGVSHQHPQPGGRSGVLGTRDHLGEEGIADVDHRHSQQAAPAGTQLLRGLQGYVAQLLRRRSHASDEAVTDRTGAVEGVRDGADRHPGTLGDIADADSLHDADESVMERAPRRSRAPRRATRSDRRTRAGGAGPPRHRRRGRSLRRTTATG